ncbi:Isochorismate pyruvate-lyase [hydrothermal vent metagenome]|uniref:Isochorismate pyruvate-lyase n=1 Tax=hydrothermal vent metagenome TaxID=652676 RepID=A0A1W1CMK9_9ZZZZ
MNIKKCKTLEEARIEIDGVDEKLVELIALRNAYIKQIAHFKNSIEEIKSEERIAKIVSRARTKAIELGLSPNLINDIFIRMIDEMVESEVSEFKNAKVF